MEVKKCPRCGDILESFQTRCSSCGFELSGQQVSSSMQKFIAEITKWDDISYNKGDFDNKKNNSTVHVKPIGTGTWILLWLVGIAPFLILYRYIYKISNGSKLSGLVFLLVFFVLGGLAVMSDGEVLRGILLITCSFIVAVLVFLGISFFTKPVLSAVDKRKEQYIKNYVIPNSKEDILEFAAFATTHIVKVSKAKALFSAEGKIKDYWNNIWKEKCKQLYVKAKLSMRDDFDSLKTVKELFLDAGVDLK